MTIRFRIIAYYSLLLTSVIWIFSVSVFGVLKWMMLDKVDADLDAALDAVLGENDEAYLAIRENGTASLIFSPPALDAFQAPGIYLQIWSLSNEPRLYSASQNFYYREPLDQAALGKAKETRSIVTIHGIHLRVITRPIIVNGQVVNSIQAATPLSYVESTSDRLIKIMLSCGVITLLVSLMLGDWLARRILKPVEAIVDTAQKITAADDLARRISYQGPRDELGRMVEVFNGALTRLEKLFIAQRRFVADVSHELRTPLTSIQGNLDLIRLYGADEKSLKAIQEEMNRTTRIVGDLLMLAQADAGQLSLSMRIIDLDHLVLDIYNEAVKLDQQAHHIKLGEIESVKIYGDRDRLYQLLMNLITNAFRYTPAGECVKIDMICTATEAQVIVMDKGIGIPSSDLEHIFDRFYRVDKARSRAAGGTGLGLSIAKWIAEAHRGRIEVESVVDQGSIFKVIFPIHKSEPQRLIPFGERKI